jgi:beta-galactosidase
VRPASLACACLCVLTLGGRFAAADVPAPVAAHAFTVSDGHFALDGKPFQIVSGEMHYPRIPREYWRARLKMAKAMGLNAITMYTFWNVHERVPGTYDFSGQNDVAEFVREAQQEGLYVILRPGPYVCAEWEFGGFPAWLLKDPQTVVRSRDPKYLVPASRWLHRLGEELAPLQLARGGPIIAVQVENEYGSFGDDREYLEQTRRALIEGGFNSALLYTADNNQDKTKGTLRGSLPDLLAAINFGPGEAQAQFALLHERRPQGPFMNGEYWDGWFDHWGGQRHLPDPRQQAVDLTWMLAQGYSVSLYMFHGGTSFGWMNGANWDHEQFQPDVTSYDYGAPLDESGRPTAKYFALRDVIAKVTGIAPPAVPPTPTTQAIGPFALTESASLWDNLPAPVISHDLKTMEDLDQAYGYILYRTVLTADARGDLVIDGLHDYALIYVNGKLVGSLDRRLGPTRLALQTSRGPHPAAGDRLDVLVENAGRINYSVELRKERKGITGSVTLNGTSLHDWKIYALPLTDPSSLEYGGTACAAAPCFYRGSFNAAASGTAAADTFLDTAGWNKGFVWLNGRPLGRMWSIGPQRTLYVPGVWLKPRNNQVVVLDLLGLKRPMLSSRREPVLDAAQ